MGSQPSNLDNRISNCKTYIYKQTIKNCHLKRPHITKMNDNVNMDNTIAGLMFCHKIGVVSNIMKQVKDTK
jgi:hypothetical protein